MAVDPLTVDWWHDLQPFGWGCDCGASEMERHSATCAVTPLYAEFAAKFPNLGPAMLWSGLDLSFVPQTVIRCAICGRERLGRDMLVIHKGFQPGETIDGFYVVSRSIYTMVKAVCPEHNRKGKMSFQEVPPNGF